MYQVSVIKSRPDFRVIIDLVFGKNRNVDSEGNSNPVYSREWTDLYIKDRESESPSIEIDAESSLFNIESDSAEFEELVALYLFLYCGSKIICNGKSLDEEDIGKLKLKYITQLQVAESSVWHRSGFSCPYPNE